MPISRIGLDTDLVLLNRQSITVLAYRKAAVGSLPFPDRLTGAISVIARFPARHEQALADTFTGVLALCAKAGLISAGVVALDGTLITTDAFTGGDPPPPRRSVPRSSGCSTRRPRPMRARTPSWVRHRGAEFGERLVNSRDELVALC